MPQIVTISGLAWGDEGKGRVIFDLSEYADVVVRVQGGANAGHTVVVGGQKFVLHLIPSGILHKDVLNVIGPAVFVDPFVLAEEIKKLKDIGIPVNPRTLAIDFRAPVVLPEYRAEDIKTGKEIGTTGRGIGPAAAAFWSRKAVTLEEFCKKEPKVCHVFQDLITDTIALLWNIVDTDRAVDIQTRILIEGAQGVLLDTVFGTYPFVTSSITGNLGLQYLAGLAREKALHIGVTKAYLTRVGNGPFPSELPGDKAKKLRELGNEFGATTGRERRCGWLDLPLLAYAVRVSGAQRLVVTKLDVLEKLEYFSVVLAYFSDVENLSDFYDLSSRRLVNDPKMRRYFRQINIDRDGRWRESFLELIENFVGVKVIGYSYGPSSKDATYLEDPWELLDD